MPCATAQVLQTRLDAKDRELDLLAKALIASEERNQVVLLQLSEIRNAQVRIETGLTARMAAIEKAQEQTETTVKDHVADSKDRIDMIYDSDRFRKAGTWAFIVLFGAFITQCVAWVFKAVSRG